MQSIQEEHGPKRTVLVDTELCRLETEEYGGLISLHWPRLKWSPTYYKMYLKLFEEVKQYIWKKGYDKISLVFIKTKNDKRVKLAKMFGFERAESINGHEVYELWLSQ